MAYNEKIADKIRIALNGTKNLVEKKMFGGIAFMVNDKMCLGVYKDDIMLRCEPERMEELLSKQGVRPFDLTSKPMKGWLLINEDGISTKKNFDYWIQIAVESSKKTTTKKKKN